MELEEDLNHFHHTYTLLSYFSQTMYYQEVNTSTNLELVAKSVQVSCAMQGKQGRNGAQTDLGVDITPKLSSWNSQCNRLYSKACQQL